MAKPEKNGSEKTSPKLKSDKLSLSILAEMNAIPEAALVARRAADPYTAEYRFIEVRGASAFAYTQGYFSLARETQTSDHVPIRIKSIMFDLANSVQSMAGRILCRNDMLASPLSWELESSMLGADDAPIPGSSTKETGAIANGCLERLVNGKKIKTAVSDVCACNLTLFDAVARMDADKVPDNFVLLEDCAAPKPNHRISRGATQAITVGGVTAPLQSFWLTGSGTVPWVYWRAEGGTIVAAISENLAYVFDPEAFATYQKARNYHRTKAASDNKEEGRE